VQLGFFGFVLKDQVAEDPQFQSQQSQADRHHQPAVEIVQKLDDPRMPHVHMAQAGSSNPQNIRQDRDGNDAEQDQEFLEEASSHQEDGPHREGSKSHEHLQAAAGIHYAQPYLVDENDVAIT